MKVSSDQFEDRAKALQRLADSRGFDWRTAAESLPKNDPVARIGLLASMLGIDFGLAFDPQVNAEAIASKRPPNPR